MLELMAAEQFMVIRKNNLAFGQGAAVALTKQYLYLNYSQPDLFIL
jgi:hypothetical protein